MGSWHRATPRAASTAIAAEIAIVVDSKTRVIRPPLVVCLPQNVGWLGSNRLRFAPRERSMRAAKTSTGSERLALKRSAAQSRGVGADRGSDWPLRRQ